MQGYAEQLAALTGADSAATNAFVAVTVKSVPALKKLGKDDLYLVIDLSGGERANAFPLTFLEDVPKSGWGEEQKTDKLVLRKKRNRLLCDGVA